MTRPENQETLATPKLDQRRREESGMALVSTILIMVLMSALLVGFFAMIAADQQSSGINRDQTQAYAAAHAGLEKLTADLGAMFTGGNYSPTTAQIAALTAAPPSLPGFEYVAADGGSGYTITAGAPGAGTISKGPFLDMTGLITKYTINVTARATAGSGGGAEVHMRRDLQTVAVPVFQFGMFSENDLSFFAGADFDFGGRVHTNQNLYLAEQSNTLWLRDIVTAAGEVVRTHLANGTAIATSGHASYVRLATTGGSGPTFRNLRCGGNLSTCGSGTESGTQEGSVNVTSVPPSTLQMVGTPPVPTMVLVAGNTINEPKWTSVSTGTYNNRIRNGRTGARRLDLPIVSDGALPVDLIRRPSLTTPDPQVVLDQRYFKMASLRILLSDRAADITGLQTVTSTPPVDLARLALDATYRASLGVVYVNAIPLAQAGATADGYRVPQGTPIHNGFLKIERQDRAGAWTDVTVEILNRGFTGRNLGNGFNWNTRDTRCATNANDDPNPNAVIRLQRVRDNPVMVPAITTATLGAAGNAGACGHTNQPNVAGVWTTTATNYIPLTLYDAREGARRDDLANEGLNPRMAGIMHYVELDVANLKTWLATHADTQDLTGYVVYFSDRRGNKNLGADGVAGDRAGVDGTLFTADDFGGDDLETGELGFEDIINPASATSVSNGVRDTGEDVNGNGLLDTYGGVPRLFPNVATAYAWAPTAPNNLPSGAWMSGAATILTTAVTALEARLNPPVFFRRALKVVNGGYTTGTLRLPANASQGLSIVAENPLYLQGNFNAPNAAGTDFGTTPGTDHVSAAVIADAVSLLSNNFSDIGSFIAPHDVTNANRNAATTWYRVAVISGKGLNFPHPTSNGQDHTDFGTDGGAHNFLRYIEDWGGQNLNYRGSIVSFYLNRQAVGTYKCCDVVYGVPSRGYKFDIDFLTPSLLPPRTPMFRDVNTLTFRQLLRPGQ
jgi:hypothetical protein